MKLTRNATIFATLNSITTVLFLLKLNALVTMMQFNEIAPWAIVYGLTWAVSGAVLGGSDKARSYRGNIDLQYALISSVVSFLSLWLSKLFLPAIMPISYGYIVLLSLGIIIASGVQYYLANKDPKGINKKDAFK